MASVQVDGAREHGLELLRRMWVIIAGSKVAEKPVDGALVSGPAVSVAVNMCTGADHLAAGAARRTSTADFELAARRPRLDFDRPEMASAG
jgi:hypothetical protein